MGYTDEKKFGIFLDGSNIEHIKTNVEAILRAIDNNEVLPDLSLRDIIHAFIYHQSEVGADDTSKRTRSFGNVMVSNMKAPSSESGLYPIRYHNEAIGNEVDVGYHSF